MDNKKPLLPVKSDFVFRRIFGDQRNDEACSLTTFVFASVAKQSRKGA